MRLTEISNKRHATFKALLASDRYANLRDWAAKQAAFFDQEMRNAGNLINISGYLNDPTKLTDVSAIDDSLCATQSAGSTRILLIDGPAGIGKTQFITSLAKRRADGFVAGRRPLILHVQSRGRALSYLYDLVAFSLQRVRLDVTFDQAPILAKHGLITLAIDGFDELADPDGYENAWSQVSDLITILRGSGSIILAGRETFIGRDRILNDISSLRLDKDEINVLTLQPPSKSTAVSWLVSQGWQPKQVDAIEDYLEPQSLALRPFFLKTLSNPEIAKSLELGGASSVLAILMEAMIAREIGKFGEAVDRSLSESARRKYLLALLEEAARDMAESNNAAISDATLSWLVEMALPQETAEQTTRILKARSQAIAFFTNDERSGYKRFFHDKFYEYFLSLAAIEMIMSKEGGRIFSRNILGSSFLETFADVVTSVVPQNDLAKFCQNLLSMFESYPPVDRTRRNLASLALAALTIADSHPDYRVEDVDLDECRIVGNVSGGIIKNVTISQLDCRGADLTALKFESSVIVSLIADGATVLPDAFPEPQQIRDVSSSEGTIFSPAARQAWIRSHLEERPIENTPLVPAVFKHHPAIKLLKRACRTRQYWLRRSDDKFATRILDDAWWPKVEALLAANGLLKVELRDASGTDPRFVHIRQSSDLLGETEDDQAVVKFYRDLVVEISS